MGSRTSSANFPYTSRVPPADCRAHTCRAQPARGPGLRTPHPWNIAPGLTIADQGFAEGETTVYLSFVREVAIRGKELGKADGLLISAGGTLSLQFDSKGELIAYSLDDNTEDTAAEEKKGVLELVRTNGVYFAQPGETVNVKELIQEGKRFYVQVGRDGRKRLHRAYI